MPFPVIAPTLAPLRAAALARGALAALAPSLATDALTASLATLFPGSPPVLYDSGRAALAEALRVAMRATGRRRVVLPAYTSYSVAAAATVAGCEPVLCDVDPATLALDPDALRRCTDERTAAVVIGNLFGWPEPTTALGWLDNLGVVVVDDAAQALGASEGGRPAGQRGRLGVLSFGRGKCVTLGDGGVLLFNDAGLRRPVMTNGVGRGGRELALALAVSVSRSRIALGVLSRLPGVRLGESHYEPAFGATPAPASIRAMAVDLPASVERMRSVRRGVFDRWRAALTDVRSLDGPPDLPGSEAACLRYPVRATTRDTREQMVEALGAAGFAYVRSYPEALSGIPAFARTLAEAPHIPGAEELATRLIALPCHVGVHTGDMLRAARALVTVVTGARRAPGAV